MSSNSPEHQPTNMCSETGPLSRGRQLNRSPETQPISPLTQVPLQFVHVPNSQNNVHTMMMPRLSHRTPSVPDFASYRTHHHHHNHQRHHPTQSISPPHLSGEILRNAAGTDPMEQFEERLRRAQLTLSQDRAADLEFATRVRSRSTPSRGYAAHRGNNRTEEDMRDSALRLQQEVVRDEVIHADDDDGGDMSIVDNIESSYPSFGGAALTSDGVMQSVLPPPAAARPPSIGQSAITEQSNSSPKAPLSCAETNNIQLHNRNLSSVSSSSPTHRIPSPPPLPPPPSERERPERFIQFRVASLVQREREARSETERARRRHLALQRERQLEENPTIDQEENIDVSIRNNDRPTSVGSLEVVETVVTFLCEDVADNRAVGSYLDEMQFCDIEHGLAHNTQDAHLNAPQSSNQLNETRDVPLGLNNHDASETILVHRTTNSISNASVGTTSHISGISEPPPLPPPATERERLVFSLVLREREARLETERARRRHLALLREQGFEQHEEMESFDDAEHIEDNGTPQNGEETTMDQVEQIREGGNTNNNLSYTMERFLETIGEEDRNALIAVGLTPNESGIINADVAPLPYTMELFLSENVAVDGSGDDIRGAITIDASDILIEDETIQHVAAVNHSLVEDSSESDCIGSSESVDILSEHAAPSDSNAASTGNNNLNVDVPHLGSSASNIDQELPRELSPNVVANQRDERRTNSREMLQVAGSPLHQSDQHDIDLDSDLNGGISPLHQSNDDFTQLSESVFPPQMPQLTEEGIAQLGEMDHASIGNVPPRSVRSEPSESSLPNLVQDHGFSVATQTTAIESVTETSQGSANQANGGQLSSDSTDVIRIGAVGNSTTVTIREDYSVDNSLASLRASNTSVEAIPSIASVIDSGSESHVLSNSSSSDLHSSPRSSVIDSYVSSGEESRILSLTEEGVVAMEEIDQASIGNVPPRSVRDESNISQSSGRRGFRTTPRDTFTANASIEAMPSVDSVHSMSQDSVDAMPSEYNDNSLLEGSNETGDEDLLVCHTTDMASIEALPSVISEDNNFVSLTRHESNETEDEDLMVYQSSDRASSTSIEALPSDDDNSSIDDSVHSPPSDTDHYGATRLNGLYHSSLQEHLVNEQDGESTPLLPVTQTNVTGNSAVQARQIDYLGALSPILISFASGCLIGGCVVVFLFRPS